MPIYHVWARTFTDKERATALRSLRARLAHTRRMVALQERYGLTDELGHASMDTLQCQIDELRNATPVDTDADTDTPHEDATVNAVAVRTYGTRVPCALASCSNAANTALCRTTYNPTAFYYYCDEHKDVYRAHVSADARRAQDGHKTRDAMNEETRASVAQWVRANVQYYTGIANGVVDVALLARDARLEHGGQGTPDEYKTVVKDAVNAMHNEDKTRTDELTDTSTDTDTPHGRATVRTFKTDGVVYSVLVWDGWGNGRAHVVTHRSLDVAKCNKLAQRNAANGDYSPAWDNADKWLPATDTAPVATSTDELGTAYPWLRSNIADADKRTALLLALEDAWRAVQSVPVTHTDYRPHMTRINALVDELAALGVDATVFSGLWGHCAKCTAPLLGATCAACGYEGPYRLEDGVPLQDTSTAPDKGRYRVEDATITAWFIRDTVTGYLMPVPNGSMSNTAWQWRADADAYADELNATATPLVLTAPDGHEDEHTDGYRVARRADGTPYIEHVYTGATHKTWTQARAAFDELRAEWGNDDAHEDTPLFPTLQDAQDANKRLGAVVWHTVYRVIDERLRGYELRTVDRRTKQETIIHNEDELAAYIAAYHAGATGANS